MDIRQKRTLQAFRRAQNWLLARADLTTTTPTGPQLAGATPKPASAPSALGEQSNELDTVVEQVTKLAADQVQHFRGSKGSTAEAARLRAELFDQHIRPIARMAQLAIPDVVRMTESLRSPKANIDAEGLLAAAEAMANASAEYADVLEKRGLSVDFETERRDAMDAYRTAIDAAGEARGSRRGATQGMQDAFDRGRKILASMSVLVNKTLRGDPQGLAEWQQLSRVTLKGVQPTAAATAVPVPTPVATVPATTAPVAAAPAAVQASVAPDQHKAA